MYCNHPLTPLDDSQESGIAGRRGALENMLIIGVVCALLEGCAALSGPDLKTPAARPTVATPVAQPVMHVPSATDLADGEGAVEPIRTTRVRKTAESAAQPVQVVQPKAPRSHPGLWASVARSLELNHQISRARVQTELRWYQRNPDYLVRVAKRAAPHLPYIVEQIEARGLPAELALLPVIESAYDPFAYSHGRAAGLWQFVPGTGRRYGLRINWWQDERRDVKRATDAALQHLTDLAKIYDGSWLLALAAYNSGPGNVNKALRRAGAKASDSAFWGLKLPAETQTYVPRLLALSHQLSSVYKTLPVIEHASPWTEVTFDSQVDLAVAAEISGVALADLYKLNAGLNRWATPPDAPHRLLLPSETTNQFQERLRNIPKAERVAWLRHVIRNGESLSVLAARYKTTVAAIRSANRLRSTVIRADDTLMIPVAQNASTVRPFTQDGRAEARDKRLQRSLGNPIATYTVQQGDTWWDISRKYGVGMRQLARWNSQATRDLLRPGQILKVYGDPKSPVPAAQPLMPTHPQETRRLSYRVRKGDSLWLIANRFNITVDSIRSWNEDAKGKYLQPGDRLTLYVDVIEQGL